MDLYFAHIHRCGTNALQQSDTAARRAFVVRGNKTGQIRAVFHNHRAVGAETAAGNNHAGGLYVQRLVFIIQQTHAAYFALREKDLFDGGIEHHVNAAFGDVANQTTNKIAADRRSVARAVSTVNTHATGGRDVVKHNAALREPFDSLRGIFNKAMQQLRIVLVAAAFQRLRIEEFFAVLDPFNTLEAGFGSVHARRGFDGVAANGRHLLDDQHAGTIVMGLDGRCQTSAAATHDDHIILFRFAVSVPF